MLLRSFESDFRVLRDPAAYGELLHRIFAISSEMICITTLREAKYVYVNDVFLEVTGFTREELLGASPIAWMRPEEREPFLALLEERGVVTKFEADFVGKGGVVSHALLNAQRIEVLGVPCVLTVARNLTKEQGMMKESFHQKMLQELRQTLKSLPNLVYRMERNERGELVFTLCEGKLADAMGITTEQLRGKTHSDLFSEEKIRLMEPHIRLALAGQHAEFELELDEKMYHNLLSPYWKDGSLRGVVGAVVDISERKRLETMLQRSEMNAVLGQLAAGAAHEIRNPLAAIKGFVQLAGELFDRSGMAKGRAYVELALTELDRVNELVTEMLWLRKPRESVYESVSVNHLLLDMLPLLHVEANIKSVQVMLQQEETSSIRAKSDLLKQVVLNLCKNGIEAMAEGGCLSIDVGCDGGKVFARIRDNGPGLSEEARDKLFTPFFTTKENGNGLGLFICRQIVQDMGGDIEIESDRSGTTATLTFPAADQPL